MSALKNVPSIDTQDGLNKFIRYVEDQVLFTGLSRSLADRLIEKAEEEYLKYAG
jgi:hypothetical protein